jgi:hypothetical protein
VRRVLMAFVLSTSLAIPATSAFAAPTNPPNCLGQDRAGFAHDGIPLFGIAPGSGVAQNLIKVFATAGGIGDEVAAHRAGTGDADAISTCND